MANKPRPYNFRKTVDDGLTGQVIRALYVAGTMAFGYFAKFADYQQRLAFSHFQTALGQLGIQWHPTQLEQVFDAILLFADAAKYKVLTTEQIDDFFHFSCERTLEMLHDEVL